LNELHFWICKPGSKFKVPSRCNVCNLVRDSN